MSKRSRGQSRVGQSNGGSLSRSATAREERDNGQVLKSSWLDGNREVVNNDVSGAPGQPAEATFSY